MKPNPCISRGTCNLRGFTLLAGFAVKQMKWPEIQRSLNQWNVP